MKKIVQKIKNSRGESFAEVLGAILIFSFSIITLLGATGVARKAYAVSDKRVETLYAEISDANNSLTSGEAFDTACAVTYHDGMTGATGNEARHIMITEQGFAVFKE